MKWHHFVSFLARNLIYQNCSTLETSQIHPNPLNTSPPWKPPEFVFFLSWTSKEFSWNVALFFLSNGLVYYQSIHVTNNKLSDTQKKNAASLVFFSRTHFEIDRLINVDHFPILLFWKKCTFLKGTLIPSKNRSLTSIVMPCWDGHCQVSKITGDMKPTVDGRNPAPPGMYKTLKIMG